MAAGWKNCSRTRPCPICEDLGHKPGSRQRCGYTEDGAHHCFRSGGAPMAGWRIVSPMAQHGGTVYRRSDDPRVAREISPEELERQRVAEELEWRAKVAKARALWDRGITGDPALPAYFAARLKTDDQDVPASLRFAPSIPFSDGNGFGKSGPAVLCAMTDAQGDVNAVHRIYLEPGSNPPTKRKGTDAPKQMLGKPSGSGVRFPAKDGSFSRVIVCEGIETARALWLATGWHVIAGFSGNGMMTLVLDARECLAEVIVVAGDYDEINKQTGERPGSNFAAIAANRLWAACPAVSGVAVAIPSHASVPEAIDLEGNVTCGTKGVDWEDVARFFGLERVRALMVETVKGALARAAQGSRSAPTAAAASAGAGGDAQPHSDPHHAGHPHSDDAHPMMPKGDLARARMMIEGEFMFGRAGERYTVAYDYGDKQWYTYAGTHWQPLSEEEMRSRVLRFSEPYYEQLGDGRIKKVGMSAKAAENVVKSIQTDAGVRVDEMPAWVPPTIDQRMRPLWATRGEDMGPPRRDPRVVIPLREGLLDVDAWLDGEVKLLPHTPRYLSSARPTLSLDVEALAAYLRDDPACEDRGGALVAKLAPTWLDVVGFASEGDSVWQECLGRAFGVSMTPDTSMERIFFIEGPPGSCKGTIFEGLIAMLGEDLVATSSLTDVCEKFEASAWRGRRVVGMTDASVGRFTDPAHAVEIIKRISGSDPIASEKKYQNKAPFWRPHVHLWIVSNDLLKLPDPSLSLRRRLVAMPTSRPVGEKQDPRVKERIRAEGAGILVWALCHLKALRADRAAGRPAFTLPGVGREAVALFSRNSSPVAAFIQDCCRLDDRAMVSAKVLYEIFEHWCDGEGVAAMGKEKFGAALRGLVPGMDRRRMVLPGMAQDAGRQWVYTGVRPLLLGEDAETAIERRGEQVFDLSRVATHICPAREYGHGQDQLPV
jgi:P4 family phage/plasmid primase-like protien